MGSRPLCDCRSSAPFPDYSEVQIKGGPDYSEVQSKGDPDYSEVLITVRSKLKEIQIKGGSYYSEVQITVRSRLKEVQYLNLTCMFVHHSNFGPVNSLGQEGLRLVLQLSVNITETVVMVTGSLALNFDEMLQDGDDDFNMRLPVKHR